MIQFLKKCCVGWGGGGLVVRGGISLNGGNIFTLQKKLSELLLVHIRPRTPCMSILKIRDCTLFMTMYHFMTMYLFMRMYHFMTMCLFMNYLNI